MPHFSADWPDDADGGVFRNLAAGNFNFSVPHSVDYNVDFDRWPPAAAALEWLRAKYGEISLYAPTEDMNGYVQFQVLGRLTYEGVKSIQRRVSAAMEPFGGACESWGVMHNAA